MSAHSWSSISSHMKCPRQYKLSYVLGYRAKNEDKRAMMLGSAVHEGVKVFLNLLAHGQPLAFAEKKGRQTVREYCETNRDRESLDPNYHGEIDALAETGVKVFSFHFPPLFSDGRYRVATSVEFGLQGEDVPLVEYRFSTRLEDEAGNASEIQGTIDAVLYDTQTEEFVLFDWKVRGALVRDAVVNLDGQLQMYAAVLNALGEENQITRIVMYQVRNDTPKPPVFKKDNTPSVAQIASTWEVWSEGVRAVGQDPEKYREEMMPKMRTIDDYRLVVDALFTPTTSYNVMKDVADRIARIAADKTFPRALSTHVCGFCSFASVCQAAILTEDPDATEKAILSSELFETKYVLTADE